jgi:hypothetical protein
MKGALYLLDNTISVHRDSSLYMPTEYAGASRPCGNWLVGSIHRREYDP